MKITVNKPLGKLFEDASNRRCIRCGKPLPKEHTYLLEIFKDVCDRCASGTRTGG